MKPIGIAAMTTILFWWAGADHPHADAPGEIELVSSATTSVLGGVHDFSAITGQARDVCGACHVPHVQAVRKADQKEATGDANLELYKIEGQREVLQRDRYTPGPTSLICLSCHNGTIAKSTIGSSHAMLGGIRDEFDIQGGFALRDHPIGIPYPENRRDYKPKHVVEAQGAIRLPEGRLECISCHDPHGGSGVEKLLVMSNRRSALCLSCHVK